MIYNVVKAELISNKSEWSMGVEANVSESKCVKLTLENPDDWQDEGGVFIFFQEQSPRIFERWAKIFEDLGNKVIEGESIPERFRVMKNVVIDWYNLPEPCFKKYDKKIYCKGNLIHNIGDTIVDKTIEWEGQINPSGTATVECDIPEYDGESTNINIDIVDAR